MIENKSKMENLCAKDNADLGFSLFNDLLYAFFKVIMNPIISIITVHKKKQFGFSLLLDRFGPYVLLNAIKTET